jgi:hypothetical protein
MPHRRHDALIDRALQSAQPSASLEAVARDLKAEGMSQAEMYALFEAQLVKHRADPDERLYDAIADTLDMICGWCGPHRRLFGTAWPR